MRIIIFCGLLMMLTACHVFKPNVALVYQVDRELSSRQQDYIKWQLQRRLLEGDLEDVRISSTSNSITLAGMTDVNELAFIEKMKSVCSSSNLAIWPAYFMEDAILQGIPKEDLEVADFFSFKHLPPENYPKTVMGICVSPDRLEAIRDTLAQRLNNLSDLALMWSLAPIHTRRRQQPAYQLYALKKGQNDRPLLTESEVAEAFAEQEDYGGGYRVNIRFKTHAVPIWAALTQKAVEEGNRALAITVNQKVYTAPVVQEPIRDGRCVISGILTFVEAAQLAHSLTTKPLPVELKLVEEQIMPKTKY